MSVNSSSIRVSDSANIINAAPAEAESDAATVRTPTPSPAATLAGNPSQTVCVPRMRSIEKLPNPLGAIPSDLMHRLFEDLIEVRTPRASLFRLSKTCKFFRDSVRDFLVSHSTGQRLRARLKLFTPRQPFSELFIGNRSEQLKNNFLAHRLFEDMHATSFRADRKVSAGTVIKKLHRHLSQRLTSPFRLVWPVKGGWWDVSMRETLRSCHHTVLNFVFNDTVRGTLISEMFPALGACAPGCSVILELRRTELDDQLLLALGTLCHEHPVIYQISLQSWKPEDSGALCEFLSGLMRLPNAVQVIDMSYGTPITDDVAAAITKAIPLLGRPIELRFPTLHMSESAMEALIGAAVKKNASGDVLCNLKLYIGEDMYSAKKPSPEGLYLDVATKASLKARGVRFSKVHGCSEGKDPAFLFWL